MSGETQYRLIMVTAVWGDWHLRMLCDVNLPTLLADGNLPALARNCRITYLLFTQRADLQRLNSSPQIQALRKVLDVRIEILDQAELSNPIAAHHKVWSIAERQARREHQFILLMPPDVAWANNAFKNVGARLSEGRKAIFMTYVRVVTDSFVPELLKRRNPSSAALSVAPQDMVRLSLQNLHPLMAAYLRSTDHFPYHPEMMLWTVPGEGILARVLAREMFLFDPAHFALNHVSLPADRIDPTDAYFMADSDELFAVSLAPLGKDVDWHLHPRSPDPVEIGGWWLDYDSPVNDFVAGHKIFWHYTPISSDKWRARSLGSDIFVRRTAAAREGIRIWHCARQLNCTKAAPILALAIHTGVFARAAQGRGPALVFVPSDKAMSRIPGADLDRLLAPEGAKALSALIRAHHVPDFGWSSDGDDPLSSILAGREDAELATETGDALQIRRENSVITVNGARIVGSPAIAGGHAAYQVDSLLSDPFAKMDDRYDAPGTNFIPPRMTAGGLSA